ncbi:DUF6089 family protein [Pontibacter sp. G13]|uniref:DUF6089 family protein n=1 Tax=Pontibacter sp. G13 TaxID=3074898 RepID=UPI00288952FC|nr:DUF6089 family protein [Pontibacter sp. G13]WNJ21410.1 DUF6089 family protein [Pontibacter sp. G13]
MNIKKLGLLLALVVSAFLQGQAQRSHAFGGGVGTIYYYGDLTDRFNNSLLRPSFTAYYQYYLIPTMSFKSSFTFGEIGATDDQAIDEGREFRNLHFKSPIYEFSTVVKYEFIRDKHFGSGAYLTPHFSPYLFVGISVYGFNPKAKLGGEWYALQPLGTEGQYITNASPGPYSRFQMNIPLGVGLNIRLAKYAGVNIEFGYRMTFTDYLDDVSTVYPDFKLLEEVSGPTAVQLSRRSPTDYFGPGDKRGNPEANDGYFVTNVSLVYYLSRFARK